MFVHCVYFHLNEDAPADTVERMLSDCDTMLKSIPSVRHIFAGRPVPSNRDVVDSSYDVGLCVVFDTSDGHDEYQEHHLHREFISRYSLHWRQIRVFDTS